jgi:type IX secretion system PorP/SprF family membrane protein
MRKNYYAFLLFVFFSLKGTAQQLHFTSQYLQHNAMYNPAAAGFYEKSVIGTSYRSMWSAFPGNPKTFMVYGDVKWDKMNAGLASYIDRDQTGPTSRTGIQLAYSYHVKTSEKGRLGLGIELRGLQYAIDRTKLTEALGSDLVLSGANSKFKLDAGAGVYYTDGKLSAGAAVSQLIQSKLAFADVPNATERAKLFRHYNFMANYSFQTGGGTHLIPNFMMRVIPNAPTEFDFGCKVDYKDRLWWAINWRVRQFWSLQFGFKLLDRIGFAYSYDYYAAPFSDYNTGNNAHEVGLRFELKK